MSDCNAKRCLDMDEENNVPKRRRNNAVSRNSTPLQGLCTPEQRELFPCANMETKTDSATAEVPDAPVRYRYKCTEHQETKSVAWDQKKESDAPNKTTKKQTNARNPYHVGSNMLLHLSDSELWYLGLKREKVSQLTDDNIKRELFERRLNVINRKAAGSSSDMLKTLSMLRRAGTPTAVVVRVLWQIDQIGNVVNGFSRPSKAS